MQTRLIVVATLVIGLALGIGQYVTAQENPLPNFAPGDVLTAENMNSIVTEVGGLGVEVKAESSRLDALVNILEIPPPDPDTVCTVSGLCRSEAIFAGECQRFLDSCSTAADAEDCARGALAICEAEEVPEDVDETTLCSRELCGISSDLAEECRTFLSSCLSTEPELNHDECLGAALFKCRANLPD